MRESVLFDNKECSSYARRENREREGQERGRQGDGQSTLLPQSLCQNLQHLLRSIGQLRIMSRQSNATLKYFAHSFQACLRLSTSPCCLLCLSHCLDQTGKCQKSEKWPQNEICLRPTQQQQQRGNNFHKAKHLLYLPNGVWKQARNQSGLCENLVLLFPYRDSYTHTDIDIYV